MADAPPSRSAKAPRPPATSPAAPAPTAGERSPTDPIAQLFEQAGLELDPVARGAALLAAAAQRQLFENGRSTSGLVSRSTLLWALASRDDVVRRALARSGLTYEGLTELLGITGEPEPVSATFEITADVHRALKTISASPQESEVPAQITPSMLAEAVLEDVREVPGLLAGRLGVSGTDAAEVLAALHGTAVPTPDEPSTEAVPILRMADHDARRFGVQLPDEVLRPSPYVVRDVDAALDRALSDRRPTVTIVAPPVSGASRAVYESLLRVLPNARVLLTQELIDGGRDVTGHDLDVLLTSGADVVWVRNLRTLVERSPVFADWFPRRRPALAVTVVTVVRPEDRNLARELGLLDHHVVEMSPGLSAEEQGRAATYYVGHPGSVSELALAIPQQRGPVRASYAADSAAAAHLVEGDSDSLDIRTDVDMLAKLIASKDVDPPLSIGLFGPWGSGKSFLMHQVQLRLDDLADRSKSAPAGSSGYLKEIVSVEFNAWQYAHGSALWASLINRVFEGIQERLSGDERYQQVLKEVAAKHAGVEEAHRRLESAEKAVKEAEPAGRDRAIKEVVEAHDDLDDAAVRAVRQGLALDPVKDQVSDLREQVVALTTTTAQLRKGWATASKTRRALVLGVAVAALALLGVVTIIPSALQVMATVIAVVTPAVTSLTVLLRPVNKGLEEAARLLRADQADQIALQRAQQRYDDAVRDLAEAKATGLAGLYGFVSDRTLAEEYRRQLGMAPMIRDDLKRLAAMAKSGEGLPGIDRIVIFIDDLDRCPAPEVVRVLEAVNLLFGFELFVVVVAVDSRWLIQSLRTNFSAAFSTPGAASPTPQNYLEKIIQIPFWLSPMRRTGFERLVLALAGPVSPGQSGEQEPETPSGEMGEDRPNIEPGPFEQGRPSDEPQLFHDPARDRETQPEVNPPAPVEVGTRIDAVGSIHAATGDPVTNEELNPEALRLTQNERDFMLTCYRLVTTPRAVKRFLNTYQLLRVSVERVDRFLEDREFQPVLLLLALMTGTMPITDDMVRELRTMSQAHFQAFLGERADDETWKPVSAACERLPTSTLTPAVIDVWMPRVARYSFHPIDA